MDLINFIGKWGGCNLGIGSLHNDDLHLLINYPYKNQIHKCIRIEDNFLVIKFLCIELRVFSEKFQIVEDPFYRPLDIVSYISSNDKLEFGVITEYRMIYKPETKRTYILSVNGKLKSTLYEKERLQLVTLSSSIQTIELSKAVSQILRHNPSGLSLENGWMPLTSLILELRSINNDWQNLEYYDILRMIDNSEKKRHEVKSERIGPEYKNTYVWYIRAKYGHSIDDLIILDKKEPTELLYHGTSKLNLESILKEGIKPMGRQFVHLTNKISEAYQVGSRKEGETIIFCIDAKVAFSNGVNFYQGNDSIWISDSIDPIYLKIVDYPA